MAHAEWEIDPADESRLAMAAAEYAREIVATIPDVQDAIFDLLDAIGKGFSPVQIHWQTSKNDWQPVRLEYVPQRWFTVAEDGTTLLLRGEGYGDDVELNPTNWIVHRARGQSGYAWRQPLLRACVRAFIVRHFGWKDWMSFAEVYGMPARIGKLQDDVAWNSAEATQLKAAVRALGHDYAAVVRSSNEIELLQVANGEGQIYERILELADRELTLSILGQTLTSGGEGGGSYALGQVHNIVRMDLLEADAKALGETLTHQLLRPIVRLNLGESAPLPRWDFLVERPSDMLQESEILGNLVTAGVEIAMDEVRERFGYRAPVAGEAIVVPFQVRALTGQGTAEGEQEGQSENALRPAFVAQPALVPNQADVTTEGPVPEDGLRWLGERRVATDEAWERLGPAGKQRAWYVTGLDQERIAQAAVELTEAYRTGATANAALTHLEALGIAVPGGQTPGDNQIPAAQARLVYRQNLFSAYGADRWIKGQRGIAERPYGQYLTAGDERVRAEHAALDGIVKPLDDPFWASYMPPWDYNCRCTLVTVSRTEMDAEGLEVEDEIDEAARYQAALVLQGMPLEAAQIRDAARDMRAVIERSANVAALKAPANPQWQFDRRDAYGLESEGWQPATEAGRADLEVLRTMPLVEGLV